MLMSEGILFELQFFSRSLLLGVVMMIAYDGIRIFRFIVPHKTAAVAVEDLVYWLGWGGCIVAVVLGMLLYLQVSKILKKIGKKLHSSIKRVIMDLKSL